MKILVKGILIVGVALLLLPARASAQVGEIAGQVRDASGAVLAGVTVIDDRV